MVSAVLFFHEDQLHVASSRRLTTATIGVDIAKSFAYDAIGNMVAETTSRAGWISSLSTALATVSDPP